MSENLDRAAEVKKIADAAITNPDVALGDLAGGSRADAVQNIGDAAITGGDLDMSPEGVAAMIDANRAQRDAANDNTDDAVREEAA